MANEQLALYDVPPIPPKQENKQKKSWEDGFQKWSNKQFGEGATGYGACGYGSMCDYCTDNTYGRPCVRALNEMCREMGIAIDYSKRNYEQVWDGRFEDGK